MKAVVTQKTAFQAAIYTTMWCQYADKSFQRVHVSITTLRFLANIVFLWLYYDKHTKSSKVSGILVAL